MPPDIDWSRTVFLIGGGPSASHVDLKLLRGRGVVVALNDSLRMVSWADAVFTIDDSWVNRRLGMLKAFKGRKIIAAPREDVVGDIGEFESVERLVGVALSWDPRVVHQGGNSGFAAICAAAARGAKRIVLIGYDMVEAGHWHGGYEWKCRFGVRDYPHWAKAFDAIAPSLARHGVDVINLNNASAIRCFRFAKLGEVLD